MIHGTLGILSGVSFSNICWSLKQKTSLNFYFKKSTLYLTRHKIRAPRLVFWFYLIFAFLGFESNFSATELTS